MSASALPFLDAVTRETLRTKPALREVGRMVRLYFLCSSFPLSVSNAY
jgi:hypothetical protein